MARAARQRPKRLGFKLRQARKALSLTQEELIKRLRKLGVKGLAQGSISAYESNRREPSLIFILMFARIAGIPVETLLDDKLNLPENNRYRVIKHKDE
jgi:transcriptional regulator with XRE-family HTH domain